MSSIFENYILLCLMVLCVASHDDQYKVPMDFSNNWESYVLADKEYIIQNLPQTWENAKILCRGHHNSTLAILDTKEKAEFLAETLSESQFTIESIWVGARRSSAEDPAGYRWGNNQELSRTTLDVLGSELEAYTDEHYPVWLNRTSVPVPDAGADCVAMGRVTHDRPVFQDLPCNLERSFVCEKDYRTVTAVKELRSVRCETGLYRVYDGRLDWYQAAAHCVLNKMSLANIATMTCLRKLGLTMLKTRPSIESAWIGAKGAHGMWSWVDTGLSIFEPSIFSGAQPQNWPPIRDRLNIKQSGCLQLDRHSSHVPVFIEARCERKMQFICYQGVPALTTTPTSPSDDLYYYILVRKSLYWQQAYNNCLKMNGTLASVDSNDMLIQLLLLMGENTEEPVDHIWLSGRLNMSKNVVTNTVSYIWYNPSNGRMIPISNKTNENFGVYAPPWLDDNFDMDSPCLNLDRQNHLNALVYGLPCDTPQYSICMFEKQPKSFAVYNVTGPDTF